MYHYKMCGLNNVYLRNGVTIKKTPYGDAVSIENVKELHRVIGQLLISKPEPLQPEEIKFLRSELNMTQALIADMIGVSEITYRKWEKGNNKIGKVADRLLRGIYKEATTGNAAIRKIIELVSASANQQESRRTQVQQREVLQFAEDGWQYNCAHC